MTNAQKLKQQALLKLKKIKQRTTIFETRKSEIKDYLPGDFQDYFVGERLKSEIRREINFHPFLYCLEGKIMNIEGLKTRKIAMEEFYMSSKILSKQQRDNNLIKTNLEHLEKIKDCKMQTFQVIKDYLHSPLNILHSGPSQGLKIRRGLQYWVGEMCPPC